MISLKNALNNVDLLSPRYFELLKDFLRIESVSVNNPAGVNEAAQWLYRNLEKIGMTNVQLISTKGHPVVYAEYITDPKAKTLMYYGHYDVQPALVEDGWHTHPFVPKKKGDFLYGRGATDMKAWIVNILLSLDAIISAGAPINFKVMFEGEEEMGSVNLHEFMTNNRLLLDCDYAVNVDAGMNAINLPTICNSLKGLLYMEISIKGPINDLHSGTMGNTVLNPFTAMTWLLGSFQDSTTGLVLVDGFYDNFIPPTERQQLALIEHMGRDKNWYLKETGSKKLWTPENMHPAVMSALYPTFDIHGIPGGHMSIGAKTAIPKESTAKISFRLGNGQDPEDILKKVRNHIRKHAHPARTEYTTRLLSACSASNSDPDSAISLALAEALKTTWEVDLARKWEGGSIPAVGLIQHILDVPVANTGFSLPGDNMHGVDERMHIPTWEKANEVMTRLPFLIS